MKYNAVKGVQDILPPDIYIWQRVERTAREVFGKYGYQEIRPPIMEFTDVFTRSIGETSDIVEKEMYTFTDRGGRSISLRPEGTAPVVRGYVQNHLYRLPAPQKFYYMGPMFRYERPQKGRLRQFYQIGSEAFGAGGAALDAELISMLGGFLAAVGLGGLRFQVNSIGCHLCRPGYRDEVKGYFAGRLESLCADCVRRYERNPLRIMDCKVPGCVSQREGAPRVTNHLCEGCRESFDDLCRMLEMLDVTYEVVPELVRGLDYYTGTIFEVTSEGLGAQNAVAAGGRYDGLVKEFGGPSSQAIGFAVGMERLVSLLGTDPKDIPSPSVFIAVLGGEAEKKGLKAAHQLRSAGMWVELGSSRDSLKSQMRRADRMGARFVIVIGENEIETGRASWKRLSDGETGEVGFDDIGRLLETEVA